MSPLGSFFKPNNFCFNVIFALVGCHPIKVLRSSQICLDIFDNSMWRYALENTSPMIAIGLQSLMVNILWFLDAIVNDIPQVSLNQDKSQFD